MKFSIMDFFIICAVENFAGTRKSRCISDKYLILSHAPQPPEAYILSHPC